MSVVVCGPTALLVNKVAPPGRTKPHTPLSNMMKQIHSSNRAEKQREWKTRTSPSDLTSPHQFPPLPGAKNKAFSLWALGEQFPRQRELSEKCGVGWFSSSLPQTQNHRWEHASQDGTKGLLRTSTLSARFPNEYTKERSTDFPKRHESNLWRGSRRWGVVALVSVLTTNS